MLEALRDTKMTPNQINAAVAECLGWRFSPSYNPDLKEIAEMCWIRPGGEDWQTEKRPAFDSDWNTRPEMLKALSRDEQRKLVRYVWRQNPYAVFDEELCAEILNLSQPQFAELFLRVKGRYANS
jgi:hypothetical protein